MKIMLMISTNKEAKTDDLEEAIDELGSDYTEEEIRLIRIKFLSEMAN